MPSTPSEQQNWPQTESEKDFTTRKEIPVLFSKAFVLGAADVVPGVSGGTMGLILGIYKRMIDAIKSVNGTAIKALFRFDLTGFFNEVHWRFGLILIFGIFSALLFFTKVVPLPVYMYSHPELIYGLFFGLILGSVVLLVADLGRFTLRIWIALLLGTAAGFGIVNLVPTDTPDHPAFLFLTGTISISALVLPGISGSFLLLILRKYDTILGSIGQLGTPATIDALIILIPFGFGVVFGLAAFSRVLSWLLKKYYLVTLCILIGFMAGSLYIIWPFQDRVFEPSERVQVVDLDSPLAQLAAESEPTSRAPEYYTLGEIVNPDAPLEEQQVEVIQVKNNLISSSPFIPSLEKAGQDDRISDGRTAVYHGYIMMGIGLIMVMLLGWVSRVKADKRPGRPGVV